MTLGGRQKPSVRRTLGKNQEGARFRKHLSPFRAQSPDNTTRSKESAERSEERLNAETFRGGRPACPTLDVVPPLSGKPGEAGGRSLTVTGATPEVLYLMM